MLTKARFCAEYPTIGDFLSEWGWVRQDTVEQIAGHDAHVWKNADPALSCRLLVQDKPHGMALYQKHENAKPEPIGDDAYTVYAMLHHNGSDSKALAALKRRARQ